MKLGEALVIGFVPGVILGILIGIFATLLVGCQRPAPIATIEEINPPLIYPDDYPPRGDGSNETEFSVDWIEP